jgi:cysteinyl-tRNA synthetase
MELAEQDEGLSAMEIAEKYTKAFLEDGDAVGIGRADLYPRATEHIPEMIAIIERLIAKGHAYEVDGTVYFDVRTFPEYGKLSGNTIEALQAGHRQDVEVDPNKKNREDFALWKKATGGRALKWPSPWGEGFPGWHIECSAMSMKHLGERFDIHTGGNDNKFPHHEDEIAQSEGAVQHQVVSIWIHGGFLQLSGQKIAKSAKNVILVPEISERGLDPLAFRLLCFGTRYRSEMDFSWEALEAANTRLTHLRQRVAEWAGEGGSGSQDPRKDEFDRRFRDAIANDLDMPHALVVLNELVTSDVEPANKRELLDSWERVLGLDLERLAREGFEVPEEVQALIEERDRARAERDYGRSDRIRDQMTEMGWEVMDTPGGTRVRPRA